MAYLRYDACVPTHDLASSAGTMAPQNPNQDISVSVRPRLCRTITKGMAQVIFNVRRHFTLEKSLNYRRTSINQVVQRTMEATGAVKRIICQLQSQSDVDKWKYEDNHTEQRQRSMTVPVSWASTVRQIIRDMYLEEQIMPTIQCVYERITSPSAHASEGTNWKWCKETLYNFMLHTGYSFEKRQSHYEYTKERDDIICMRENYLDWINRYRNEGYRIFYQDETWVFKNMAQSKIWIDSEAEAVDYRVPSGSGARTIICHLGSNETGLLEGCLLMYRGSKSRQSDDYHTEMNADVFQDWCKKRVFPTMKRQGKKCVLVLDRATYHTKITDDTRPPTTQWRKAQLIEAIRRWDGPDDDWPLTWAAEKTNRQMLQEAHRLKPAAVYEIQRIADTFATGNFCIKVLFLPVAHPELNPIEMIWGRIKRKTASCNMTFNLNDVDAIARSEIDKVDISIFAKYYEHTLKEEEKFKELSNLLDAED